MSRFIKKGVHLPFTAENMTQCHTSTKLWQRKNVTKAEYGKTGKHKTVWHALCTIVHAGEQRRRK